MFGLVDCNNFYASCERVFRPDIRTAPVGVLSNNDGCLIARSREIKDLGIKMGVPYYQIKEQIKRYNIQVFSSNYELYGDMSNRVMRLLRDFVQDIEVYSIDEAFLDFHGYERFNLKEYGEKIVHTVTKGTGIPVSLGIAPTKTLAKVANKFAKKYPGYKGCCIIDTEEKRIKALQKTEVSDVWGIGRQHTKFLNKYNVKNAYEFTRMPKSWVRANMTVVGERMWEELNGIPRIALDEGLDMPKKTMCTSRAFGETISHIEGLREAVSTFAAMCAAQLRKQGSSAVSIMVFIHTNNFKPEEPQYARNCILDLPVPTSVTAEIIKYANIALSKIYRPGFKFKKAGVIITGICPDCAIQQDLFDTNLNRDKHARIMPIMDKLNSGFNRNSLIMAAQMGSQKWKMKQNHKSPCYTTRVSDFPVVKLH